LRGGSNNTIVVNLPLTGSGKEKPLKIRRVRIDPIQESRKMAESNITLKKTSILGK
jgi:hypothetical protein